MKPAALLKRLGAVSALLVLLWLVYLYQQIPHRKAPYAKALASADGLHLEQGAQSIDLRKTAGAWVIVDRGGVTYPADTERLKSLIDALTDLQLDEVISDRPDRAHDFDLTPEHAHRVILRAGSRTLVDGQFGKQSLDFTHIFFKFSDSPSVYIARGAILGDLGSPTASDWRERSLIHFGDTQIDGIRIENAGVTTDLKRSSVTWTMNGTPIDPTPVYGLVGALAHLKADDFIATASTPTFAQLTQATITVTAGTQSAVLHIGAEDKMYQRFPAAVDPQSLDWIYANKINSLLLPPTAFKPTK